MYEEEHSDKHVETMYLQAGVRWLFQSNNDHDQERYTSARFYANDMRRQAYLHVPLFRANEAMFTRATLSEKREGIPCPYYMKLARL